MSPNIPCPFLLEYVIVILPSLSVVFDASMFRLLLCPIMPVGVDSNVQLYPEHPPMLNVTITISMAININVIIFFIPYPFNLRVKGDNQTPFNKCVHLSFSCSLFSMPRNSAFAAVAGMTSSIVSISFRYSTFPNATLSISLNANFT